MSDPTKHAWRSVMKTATVTSTKWPFVVIVAFVIFVSARVPWLVSAQQAAAPPTQAQQQPVFRGGTRFVRVDAYPTENGKVVEGLKPGDFEILEDGKPQAIESFDFLRFDTLTPEAERHDPVSQQAGVDLAADPRYRLFVVYADLLFTKSANGIDNLPLIEQPLVNFFDRVIGPQDLFALLTTRNSVKDLVLAQKTTVTAAQIKDLLRAKYIERDEADEVLGFCDFGLNLNLVEVLKFLYRADASYTNLQELTRQLGSLRQERKNLVLVTNLLPRWGPNQKLYEALVGGTTGGVSKNGIQNGRITGDNREIYTNGRGGSVNGCMAEAGRLALMDFEPRYRELLDEARRQNVSFYTITPSGLQAPFTATGTASMRNAYEDLRGLADATDGLSMVDTNDLNAAFRRVAEDLSAYYLLGYYTTNTRFDGGLRKITVKVKGKAIRARREYRAPTEAEIAAIAQRPSPSQSSGAEAASGPPAVIGEPTVFRVTRAEGAQKVPLLEFARTDRIRVQWPVLAALDRREARFLDSAGKPLPFDLPVSEGPDGKTVVVELPLAPFGRGVYSIELTAGSGGKTERRRVTFTMK